MRKRLIFPPLLALLFLAVPHAFAQQDAKEAEAAKQLAAADGAAVDAARPHVIKELELTDVPLPEVINYLRQQDPAFQAVVAYAPDADRNGPVIQELRLKNVTAEAVLKILSESYEQIKINPIEGPNESVLYTIRVLSDGGGGGGGGGLMDGGGSGGSGVVTSVHRLNEIIDELTKGNEREVDVRKQALGSILSLVQAAVETEADGAMIGRNGRARDVKLKLHEATETLLFKGSGEQADLVERTLRSLRPSDVEQVEKAQREAARMKDHAAQLEQRLWETDKRRQEAEEKAREMTAEAERLADMFKAAENRARAAVPRAGSQSPEPQPADPSAAKPKQP